MAELHKCGLKSLSTHKSIPAHPKALQPATFLSYSSQLSTATKNSRVANLSTQNKDTLMYFAVLFLTIHSSFLSFGLMTCCFLRTQKMLLIPSLWHVLLSGDKSFCAMWQEWANVTEAERWAAAAQSAAFNPLSAPRASITSASSNNTSELSGGRRAPRAGEVLTSNKGCWGKLWIFLSPKDFFFTFYTDCEEGVLVESGAQTLPVYKVMEWVNSGGRGVNNKLRSITNTGATHKA